MSAYTAIRLLRSQPQCELDTVAFTERDVSPPQTSWQDSGRGSIRQAVATSFQGDMDLRDGGGNCELGQATRAQRSEVRQASPPGSSCLKGGRGVVSTPPHHATPAILQPRHWAECLAENGYLVHLIISTPAEHRSAFGLRLYARKMLLTSNLCLTSD